MSNSALNQGSTAPLIAVGKTNLAVGFTLEGGTSNKTLTVDTDLTASLFAPNVYNVKPVVNAAVNKIDIFTRSGGAAPDATNPIHIMIPDGNGNVLRTRTGAVAGGTGQIILADGANYWSKGSLDGEIKTAYICAIYSTADAGIVLGACGYSGFNRVSESSTATDDDYILLENGSTYTKHDGDYMVPFIKIRYQYDTADTPDHTIQATVLDAPQVIWNPRSDYYRQVSLATTVSSGSTITEYSAISAVVKQSGVYKIAGITTGAANASISKGDCFIKTGSSTYASAVYQGSFVSYSMTNGYGPTTAIATVRLNAGDTIHLGVARNGTNTIEILGDNSYLGATRLIFNRID